MKTLEDMKVVFLPDVQSGERSPLIKKDELRASAIEDIIELRDAIEGLNNSTMRGTGLDIPLKSKIGYIMDKFNITEDEIKEATTESGADNSSGDNHEDPDGIDKLKKARREQVGEFRRKKK